MPQKATKKRAGYVPPFEREPEPTAAEIEAAKNKLLAQQYETTRRDTNVVLGATLGSAGGSFTSEAAKAETPNPSKPPKPEVRSHGDQSNTTRCYFLEARTKYPFTMYGSNGQRDTLTEVWRRFQIPVGPVGIPNYLNKHIPQAAMLGYMDFTCAMGCAHWLIANAKALFQSIEVRLVRVEFKYSQTVTESGVGQPVGENGEYKSGQFNDPRGPEKMDVPGDLALAG